MVEQEPQFRIFEYLGEKYIEIVEPTELRHEEHRPITIPEGYYKIEIVREYDHFAEESRQVMD